MLWNIYWQFGIIYIQAQIFTITQQKIEMSENRLKGDIEYCESEVWGYVRKETKQCYHGYSDLQWVRAHQVPI